MGRFVPEKRVEDLIAAFRQLGGGTKLLLAGEVNEADPYFRALRAAAGGDPRIIFPGGLYGRAKAEALSNAALVALPSDLEGFPIALLEGMRYGRPVLASDIPENLEAVLAAGERLRLPDGRSGFAPRAHGLDSGASRRSRRGRPAGGAGLAAI